MIRQFLNILNIEMPALKILVIWMVFITLTLECFNCTKSSSKFCTLPNDVNGKLTSIKCDSDADTFIMDHNKENNTVPENCTLTIENNNRRFNCINGEWVLSDGPGYYIQNEAFEVSKQKDTSNFDKVLRLRRSSSITEEKTSLDSCYPRYSCKSSLLNEVSRLCNCDEKCILYKDCCHDSVYNNDNEMSKGTSYACQELVYDEQHLLYAFVKTNCSPLWEDESISSKCYAGKLYTTLNHNLYANIPATGSKKNVTYRNVFCALCNFEEPDQIYVWNNMSLKPCELQAVNSIVVKAEKTLTLSKSYDIGKNLKFDGLRWHFSYKGGTYFCDIGEVYIPQHIEPTLDGCDSLFQIPNQNVNCGEEDLRKNCSNSFAPVVVKDTVYRDLYFYRNKYCLFCDRSFADSEEFTCPDEFIALNRQRTKKERAYHKPFEGPSVWIVPDCINVSSIVNGTSRSKSRDTTAKPITEKRHEEQADNAMCAEGCTSVISFLFVFLICLCINLVIFMICLKLCIIRYLGPGTGKGMGESDSFQENLEEANSPKILNYVHLSNDT